MHGFFPPPCVFHPILRVDYNSLLLPGEEQPRFYQRECFPLLLTYMVTYRGNHRESLLRGCHSQHQTVAANITLFISILYFKVYIFRILSMDFIYKHIYRSKVILSRTGSHPFMKCVCVCVVIGALLCFVLVHGPPCETMGPPPLKKKKPTPALIWCKQDTLICAPFPRRVTCFQAHKQNRKHICNRPSTELIDQRHWGYLNPVHMGATGSTVQLC